MDNIYILDRGRDKDLHTCYANVNNINKVSNVRCAVFDNFSCAKLAYMKLELLKLNPVISF